MNITLIVLEEYDEKRRLAYYNKPELWMNNTSVIKTILKRKYMLKGATYTSITADVISTKYYWTLDQEERD